MKKKPKQLMYNLLSIARTRRTQRITRSKNLSMISTKISTSVTVTKITTKRRRRMSRKSPPLLLSDSRISLRRSVQRLKIPRQTLM